MWYRGGELMFNLWEDFFVIEVDRATPENAYPVLDRAVLMNEHEWRQREGLD